MRSPAMAFDELKQDCVLRGKVEFGVPRENGKHRKIKADILARFIRYCIGKPNEVLGGLHFRYYEIDGTLHLSNVDLDFPLYFDNCIFNDFIEFSPMSSKALGFMGSTLHKGIDMRDAHIKGYLLMNNGFTCHGPLLLRDAVIEKSLEFQQSSLLYAGQKDWHKGDHANKECCSLSRVRCSVFYWEKLATKPRGIVNLRDFSTRTFKNDLEEDEKLNNWPEKGQLILDGFEYSRFSQCSPTQAMKWIHLQKDVTTSSLSNLAKSYSNENLKQNSDIVLAALKKIEVGQIKNPIIRALNLTIFASIGYGAKLQRPLVILAFIFSMHLGATYALNKYGFLQPNINEFMSESCINGTSEDCKADKLQHWKKLTHGTPSEDIYLPSRYPAFKPTLYSLEAFFPFFDFHQRKYWEFSNSGINALMGLVSACGIFISGIFVGGITGFLSPKN